MTVKIDETGKRYGRLLILYEVPSNSQGARWLCHCNCGNKKIIAGYKLRNGRAASCGCRRGRTRRLKPGEASANRILRGYIKGAKRRNLTWELTKIEFLEITKKSCFYCGLPPSNVSNYRSEYGTYIYTGIDRIDNNKGYNKNNVVPCCTECNKSKGIRSQEKFLTWIKKTYQNLTL